MEQSLIAVFIFWCAFEFSIGPFWISMMQASVKTPLKTLSYEYFVYLVLGWLPLVFLIGIITTFLGGINQNFFIALHLVGMVVIFYFCYQILSTKIKKTTHFKFGVKQMSLLAWSNPKVWVLLPIGAVAAKFSEAIFINALFFYLVGIPIYIIAFFFWLVVGKLGAKIPFGLMAYINAFLLLMFALYLGYEGVVLILDW